MHIYRSSDGLVLYAVSSDGTMAVFQFEPSELEGIAPLSAQEQYLKKFGFASPSLPEGYAHQVQHATDPRMTPPPSPGRTASVAPAQAHAHDSGFGLANGGGEVVNKLVAKRNTKKRAQLTSFGVPSASIPSTAIPSAANPASVPSSSAAPSKPNGRSFHEIAGIIPSRPAQPSASLAAEHMASTSSFGNNRLSEDFDLAYPPEDVDMNTEVTIDSIDTHGQKGKRKSSTFEFPDDRPSKARTLGGDRVRESVSVRELAGPPPVPSGNTSAAGWPGGLSLAGRIPWPSLLTYMKVAVEGSEDILEVRNSEDGGQLLKLCVGLVSSRD